ncbi:Uncharacterised protein (plasmid) [Escherichia coli]|uniref:Uncharacterized protein n=2 Tax=Escherichia coli TaxID=562 RepID=A0A7I9AZU9_ECOLX|nr:Uncharacterised protein [Escherichia coli]
MKIAQQLLEAVLQFMNASAMTQVLTLIFLALIIQVLKTLITAWIVRKPSSGEMVLDRNLTLPGVRITAGSCLNKGKNMADWFIATEGVKVVKDSASLWPQIITAVCLRYCIWCVWYGSGG